MKNILIILALFIATNGFSQTIVADSLRRIEDSLGNVFYQHYTEITFDEGGFSNNLTPPLDSARYVDSVLIQEMHNAYLPLTQAKMILLNQGFYNRHFNRLNQLLSKVGISYWDFSDKLFANQFSGLWRITDTGEGGWDRFYEARIANNRLIFRQVDASFSRDSTGQRVWSGNFSQGSTNNRALIYNRDDFKFNSFDNVGQLNINFFREIPNDDNIGETRKIFFDVNGRYRFVFLRDVKKSQ